MWQNDFRYYRAGASANEKNVGVRDYPKTPHSRERPRTYLGFLIRKLVDWVTGCVTLFAPDREWMFLDRDPIVRMLDKSALGQSTLDPPV